MFRNIFILTMSSMITTTFVFAQHTKSSLTNDIINFAQISLQLKNQKESLECSPELKKSITRRLNTEIAKAKYNAEDLNQSIARYQNKFSLLHYKQARKTKKLLRSNRKLNKTFKQVAKANPEISFNQMVADLKYSMSFERKEAGMTLIASELTQAGTLVSYLESLKQEVEDCVLGKNLQSVTGGNLGLVLIIIFIGLPVLSILGAIFALIMGAFGWALGFFITAVVLLAIFFVWAQFGKSQNLQLGLKRQDLLDPLDLSDRPLI